MSATTELIRIGARLINLAHVVSVDLEAAYDPWGKRLCPPGVIISLSVTTGQFGMAYSGEGSSGPERIQYTGKQAEAVRALFADNIAPMLTIAGIFTLPPNEQLEPEWSSDEPTTDEHTTIPF